VVEDESSRLDYRYEMVVTIDANHRDMCRFSNECDRGYMRVENAVLHYINRIKVADSVSNSLPLVLLPFLRDPLFVGRDAELNELESSIFNEETEANFSECAIVGLGGVG
jgi:hypothetical protein